MRLGSVVTVNPESVSTGYPHSEIEYVDISSVGSGTLKGTRCLSLADAPSRARRIVRKGDTLLATVRPNLRAFWFARRPASNTVASTGFAVLRATGRIDERYLYYLVSDQAFTDYLAANVKGAAYPAVDAETIRRAEVPVGPLETQRKIAAVLSAYDELIENNLRRIEILEEMARYLYREWFVEFRFPGHESVRLGESPLGLLPEGWQVVRLNSLISKHIGGGWGKGSRDPEHTEPAWVLRGTDLRAARQCDFTSVPLRWHTERNLASRRLVPGDVVLEVSGGSKGQPLGRCLQVTEEWLRPFEGEAVMCASFCKRIQAAAGRIAPELLFFGLLEARVSGQMAAYEVQSTGISNLQWKRFIEGAKWRLPPTGLQSKFCEMIEALSEEGALLGRRNVMLRTARDLLLPKLISGELEAG